MRRALANVAHGVVGALAVVVMVTTIAQADNPNHMTDSPFSLLQQPVRVLDTRESGMPERITLPERPYWATVALINLTVTDTTGSGYAVAWDCILRPDTSNVNWARGDTEANLAFVTLAPTPTSPYEPNTGELCVHLSSHAEVVVDLIGWASFGTYWVLP